MSEERKVESKQLNETELRIIAELMKNSRRSDRELSKAVGVSQPTVSRTLKKLEKEGYIKEYTMIPDFKRLGLNIMALTFAKFTRAPTDEELNKISVLGLEMEKKDGDHPGVFVMLGMGLGYDAVVASFHEDLSSYMRFTSAIKQLPLIDLNMLSSFKIDLNDERQIRPITMSFLPYYLQFKSKRLSNHE